jgi:hypothetical protein
VENLLENDRRFTTLAVAEVEAPDGRRETWVAAAGEDGEVRGRYLEAGEKPLDDDRHKIAGVDKTTRVNDAKQTILREAQKQDATIMALGASRPACDKCRDTFLASGDLNAIVTPLKNPIPEHTP